MELTSRVSKSPGNKIFDLKVFAGPNPGPSIPLRAIFDPSLSSSIIYRTHVEAIKGDILSYTQTIALQNYSGILYETTGSTNLRWRRSNRAKSFITDFSIVDVVISHDFDVILSGQEITQLLDSGDDGAEILAIALARLTPGTWVR